MTVQIPDFTDHTVEIDGATIHIATGGTGPAVLLLHGFPQTHLAWRQVAPDLARDHAVVCADLPGYGASSAPAGQDDPAAYAKRRTAATMVSLMRELGHERFAVVGHDRGALVAFRAALDHPDVVTSLTVIDVLPTVELYEALSGVTGVFAFHMFLLANPTDLPERVIGAAPDVFLDHFLDLWSAGSTAIDDVRADYLAAARRPEAVHAVCQDYRAGAFVDVEHDTADREAGRQLTMPVLALWQDPQGMPLPFDPQQIWARWAPDLTTHALLGGHFLPEECPDEVIAAVRELLARTAS